MCQEETGEETNTNRENIQTPHKPIGRQLYDFWILRHAVCNIDKKLSNSPILEPSGTKQPQETPNDCKDIQNDCEGTSEQSKKQSDHRLKSNRKQHNYKKKQTWKNYREKNLLPK